MVPVPGSRGSASSAQLNLRLPGWSAMDMKASVKSSTKVHVQAAASRSTFCSAKSMPWSSG
eukprot:4723284-Heterocapsa_arctica.AAC.1